MSWFAELRRRFAAFENRILPYVLMLMVLLVVIGWASGVFSKLPSREQRALVALDAAHKAFQADDQWGARAHYCRVVTEYPGTPAADAAQMWLTEVLVLYKNNVPCPAADTRVITKRER